MSKAETPDTIESLTEQAKEVQARIDKSDSIIASEQKNRAAHGKSAFQSVPDVLRFAKIHHLLGDVLGVVGDAFQAFGGDNPMQATANGGGILGHLLCQQLVNLLVERVHLPIARDDGAGRGGIAMNE